MVFWRNDVSVGILCATVMLSMLAGCASGKADVTNITIDKNGKVTNAIYEDFGQSYYDLDELSDVALTEISTYNNEYTQEKVTLESAEMLEESGSVKVVMKYESAYDYAHFNHLTLFYGTVKEAIDSGYTIEGLIDKSGTAFAGDLSEYYDNHIVITSDRSNIRTPYDVAYMTAGVVLLSKKEAVLQDATTDTVVLLLSK
ncbi:hypothetical protein [Butyrivibrio proteoclasticus]|uniref:hypothetical protein n=1 Tax=Butyrivibrio proteoclasticus TaxID=43305 RepID=UPI00047D9368|nr:hypothetical protein [Butyrivibrio proteoclasticus]